MAAVTDRVKENVVRTLSRYSMLRFGRRLGVAVSGGADSVCLLHILARLAPELGLQISVLHVNHHLRGEESDADAAFVSELAASLQLRCEFRSLDPVALRNGNLEQNARRARLQCFAEWRNTQSLDAVALGHTQSDQAETVLMRIVRGTAPAGLAGIQAVTEDHRIRPLIETSAAEVRQWLSSRGLAWREDSSNQLFHHTRNRIRKKLLPLLAEENPRIEQSLARLAGLAAEDEDWWARVVGESISDACQLDDGSAVLNAAAIDSMELGLARRVIRRAVQHTLKGEGGDLETLHNQRLLALIKQRRDGSVSLPGMTATYSFDRVRLVPKAPLAPAEPPGEWIIKSPGITQAGWQRNPIRLEYGHLPVEGGLEVFWSGCRYNRGRHWLNGDLIAFPLVLRVWRAGDRYQPYGARREYSLHELFQRSRVPRWERSEWPLIISMNRIVWARRFGVAEWAAAAPGNSNPLEVSEA